MCGKCSPKDSLPASEPVCRICLSGENSIPYWYWNWQEDFGEPLISPCKCKGSMGLFHRSCMLYWLSDSDTTCCEICRHEFTKARVLPSFIDYIQDLFTGPTRGCMDQRVTLGADIISFLVLTPLYYSFSPLLIVLSVLRSDYLWTFFGFLTLFLHSAYYGHAVVYHHKKWQDWARKNTRDVFMDGELNETVAFPNRLSEFLAGLFCCGHFHRRPVAPDGLDAEYGVSCPDPDVPDPEQAFLDGTLSADVPSIAAHIVVRREEESGDADSQTNYTLELQLRPITTTVDEVQTVENG